MLIKTLFDFPDKPIININLLYTLSVKFPRLVDNNFFNQFMDNNLVKLLHINVFTVRVRCVVNDCAGFCYFFRIFRFLNPFFRSFNHIVFY